MKVEIHDISNINKPIIYVANSIEDCNDSVDAFAYEACVECNTVVTVGKVIAKPIQ